MTGVDWAALAAAVVSIITAVSGAAVAIINAIHSHDAASAARTDALAETIKGTGTGG